MAKSTVPGHTYMVKRYTSQGDFIQCECGWEKGYRNYLDDPEKMWRVDHLREKLPSKDVIHEFRSFEPILPLGLAYAGCTCSWKSRHPVTDPRRSWEGHVGAMKQRPPKTHKTPSSSRGSSSRRYRDWWSTSYSMVRESPWENIRPIAVEIFGGTFYALDEREAAPVAAHGESTP